MVFRRLARDSVIYGGADFFSKCVLFFTFPLIAAVLSPRAFGALELLTTTTTLVGLVMNCGLNNSTQRFYWDRDTEPKQRPILVSSGFGVLLGFGVLAISLGLMSIPVILPFVRQANLPMTWVALTASLFLLVFSQWLQFALDVLRLQFAPWRFMAVSLFFRVGGAIAAVIAVVQLGWGVDGLLSMQAVAMLAVLPVALYFIRSDLTMRVDREWVVELVRFGYPFIFMSLAYWVFGSMDRWMLASMSSVEEVGIYSVAFRFSTIVLFVSAAFGQAWSPVAIKIRTDDPAGYRQTYANVLLLLLFVMVVVGGGIALFSGELMYLIMPDSYTESAMPLTILSFGVVVQAIQQIAAIGISIEKKTSVFARLAWFTAVINLILNFILIPKYGACGAAWATMFSHVTLTISYLYFTQRLHKLPIRWHIFIFILILAVFLELSALYSINNHINIVKILLKSILYLTIIAVCYILCRSACCNKKIFIN